MAQMLTGGVLRADRALPGETDVVRSGDKAKSDAPRRA